MISFMSILLYPVSFLRARLYLIHLNTFYYLRVGLVCLLLKCFERVLQSSLEIKKLSFPMCATFFHK